MKKYKALVMDFDLTIADTCGIIAQCLTDTAAEFGINTNVEIMRRGIGCIPSVIYEKLAGVSETSLLRAMEKRYFEKSHELNLHKTKFFPGVMKGLLLLRGRRIKTAIFCQKERELIVAPLVREGMADLVGMIVSIDDVKNTKPDPEGMGLICRSFGILPSDVLYTGDSLTDEMTARAAGVDFAPVLCGVTPREKFDVSMAVGMYNTFFELCREVAGAGN